MATQPLLKSKQSEGWISLNTHTGLAIGTAMTLENLGHFPILLCESATEPTDESAILMLEITRHSGLAAAQVATGSLEIWQKSTSELSGSVLAISA